MYPVNQVFLGGDPYSNMDDIDLQIKKMEEYKQRIKQLKEYNQSEQTLLWNSIDKEILPMTMDQKESLYQNPEYKENNNKIQILVQTELLNLVKYKIENTPEGKKLLEDQLKLVKTLKAGIIEASNREIEVFREFKEYSKTNPNITYEDFIKLRYNGSK